jgi:glycolate oxidase
VSLPAIERAKSLLTERLGLSSVLTDPDACAPYCHDESEAEGVLPAAVAFARSPADIQATLAVARNTGVPVTPRTAGTGKVGGAVLSSPGMILDVSPMNRIKDIDVTQGIAVVEPGVKLAALQNAVEAEGWFFPPDPNSLEDCALGGNVATNAAGPRAFKYGPMRDYVLGLDIHLMHGVQMHVGKRTRKGVTGYDVTSLVVGSEGTLAVVSEIRLKLLPKPEYTLSLMALFEHMVGATGAVAHITASGVLPRCIEVFDATTLAGLRAAGNSIDERAGAMLLVELDGEQDACFTQAERVDEACRRGACLDVVVAQSANQRERVWAARRTLSTAVRKLAKYKMSEDIVVPAPRMPELCERVERSAQRHRVRWLAYGHAGDGNLHVNFLWDDPDDRPRVDDAIVQLFRDTVDLGGTLTGEHGVGIMKAPYLEFEQSPELIALQRQIKNVFDPDDLLNPGKIFPRIGHGNC